MRLEAVPLDTIVTSPLERCSQTAAAIAATRDSHAGALVHVDERLGECRYGDWTGKRLKKLAKDPLWRVVQVHPSAARFPGPDGEALPDMQYRAVSAVRDWNARLGSQACYLICSHGDVIKAIVADSLGLHLDQFQRIQIDPCSLTVIRYTGLRPFLVRLNDTGGGVNDLVMAARHAGRERGDAVVGGGAGEAAAGPEPSGGGGETAAGDTAGAGEDATGSPGDGADAGMFVRQGPADAQG